MEPLKDYEKIIIERLKSQIDGMAIEGFPDDPREYRLLHPKGALLVRYQGARYEESIVTGLIRQRVRLEYDVVVVSRNLRNHQGAYDMMDQVRTALTGYEIDNEKIYPVSDGFINETEGLWQYGMRFAFWALNQE